MKKTKEIKEVKKQKKSSEIKAGDVFNKMTVIKEDSTKVGKNGMKYYLCKCECGNEKVISETKLKKDTNISCGCSWDKTLVLGTKYNKLTMIKYDHSNSRQGSYHLFRCDCGVEKVYKTLDVIKGRITSCGCTNYNRIQPGTKFNNLTILKIDHKDEKGIHYLCQCDCGNQKVYTGTLIKKGIIKGCGCLHAKYLESKALKVGDTFNDLTVLEFHHKDKHGVSYYLFQCACGNQKVMQGSQVKRGITKQCGCKTNLLRKRVKLYK